MLMLNQTTFLTYNARLNIHITEYKSVKSTVICMNDGCECGSSKVKRKARRKSRQKKLNQTKCVQSLLRSRAERISVTTGMALLTS